MSWFEQASKRKKWLVGVSGGADSVALLHLLLQQGFKKLVICHLDHRLRGKESTGDAAFVKRLAEAHGLTFELKKVDVERESKTHRQSLETTARNCRHQFFRECAVKHKSPRVILAHHADDQAETVLWNLLRGSYGPKGMRQIQDFGRMEIHRPLLHWRRSELRQWLEKQNIKWREDATNTEPFAVRNRLRNEAIPLLDEISNRDSVAALNRLLEDYLNLSSILDETLKLSNIMDPQNRIHVPAFKMMPEIVRKAALARYLEDHHIMLNRDLIDAGHDVIVGKHPSSVMNIPGGRFLRRRAGRAFID